VVTEGTLVKEDLVSDHALLARDPDHFDHAAIAGRVAELVTVAEPPLNVALFGAWGSGKSSFAELLRRRLPTKDPKVRLVTYDAWKYGGHSLHRNFISHVANDFEFLEDRDKEYRQFHRGLYEKRSSVELDSTRLGDQSKTLAFAFALCLIILIVVFMAILSAVSLLTDKNAGEQISAALPAFLPASGIIAAVLSTFQTVVENSAVDIEETAPSADEEFVQTLKTLLATAKSAGIGDRFVFFVDELDRCEKDDVVETLGAIKTFLDQPDCVFIVAADREVLEEAFDALEQETPVSANNPYYSAASSFLDKVFQHQIILPPLNAGRPNGFARELIEGRSKGVWADLSAQPNHLLDRVIDDLIPTQVRSPRRVKVLLNNFATNARIAQARKIDWLSRAREIAKLTVLETEFPVLAADLPEEPDLPGLLLAPPADEATLSPRRRRLLQRHRLPPAVPADTETEEATGTSAPDRILLEREDERALVERVHREQLRRYLQKTSDIPGPRADLLYMEPAGSGFGISDADLGQTLVDLAGDDPTQLLAELEKRWTKRDDDGNGS
jgi:hypothetical protein